MLIYVRRVKILNDNYILLKKQNKNRIKKIIKK